MSKEKMNLWVGGYFLHQKNCARVPIERDVNIEM
jgi:hypothetical protein